MNLDLYQCFAFIWFKKQTHDSWSNTDWWHDICEMIVQQLCKIHAPNWTYIWLCSIQGRRTTRQSLKSSIWPLSSVTGQQVWIKAANIIPCKWVTMVLVQCQNINCLLTCTYTPSWQTSCNSFYIVHTLVTQKIFSSDSNLIAL